MSYIDTIAVYGDKKNNLESNYGARANFDAFYAWRDAHVLSEIYFYGWVIDYWMEKGLKRDVSCAIRFCTYLTFQLYTTANTMCV